MKQHSQQSLKGIKYNVPIQKYNSNHQFKSISQPSDHNPENQDVVDRDIKTMSYTMLKMEQEPKVSQSSKRNEKELKINFFFGSTDNWTSDEQN
ncbi:hypothetical protein MJO28_005455 [Puccinia striiformis f. sp. tritici]|uniref:Uncharacterized protein n=1 Tax=Puccinia striiformis f. sp. tritici TaxID=168172 RepID=A0ACC0EKX6_9BASI|nr:hypothetical protein MJO28_005455 [Puccinia striiformis f. sp. tritici]